MQFRQILPLYVAFAGLIGIANGQDQQDEVPRLVFRQGINFRSVPVTALRAEGGNFIVTQEADNVAANTQIAAASVLRVSGAEPAEITKATAMMLVGNPGAAVKQLAPLLDSQRATATVPGNFWVTAARLKVIAAAMDGDAKTVDAASTDLVNTSKQTSDPAPTLAKIILETRTGKLDERLQQFDDFISDSRPPMINGLAQFLRGDLLAGFKKDKEALDAFLSVPALNPTSSGAVVAGCEYRAALLQAKLGRKAEAIAAYEDVVAIVPGTVLAEKASQNLKSSK